MDSSDICYNCLIRFYAPTIKEWDCPYCKRHVSQKNEEPIKKNKNMNIIEAIEAMKSGHICIGSYDYKYKFKGNTIYYKSKILDTWFEQKGFSIAEIGYSNWTIWDNILENEYPLTFKEAQEAMKKGFVCCDDAGNKNKIENGKFYYLYNNRTWIPCLVHSNDQFARKWKILYSITDESSNSPEKIDIEWYIKHFNNPNLLFNFEQAKIAMQKGYVCSNGIFDHKIENGIILYKSPITNKWVQCICTHVDLINAQWKVLIPTLLHEEDEPMKLAFASTIADISYTSVIIDDPHKQKEISCTEALQAMNSGKTVQCLDTKSYQRIRNGKIEMSYFLSTGWSECMQVFSQQEILSEWRIVS